MSDSFKKNLAIILCAVLAFAMVIAFAPSNAGAAEAPAAQVSEPAPQRGPEPAASTIPQKAAAENSGIIWGAGSDSSVPVSPPPIPDAEKPVFTLQPEDARVKTGQSVTLTAEATVNDGGTITYYWFDDCDPKNYIAEGQSFTPDTSEAGEHGYWCVAVNSNPKSASKNYASEQSRTALVTVDQADYELKVVNGSGSGSYAPGERVTITAEAPAEALFFKNWEFSTEVEFVKGSAAEQEVQIIMPAADVEAAALFGECIPEKPVLTFTNDDIDTVTLSWKSVKDETSGYDIVRRPCGGKVWTTLADGIEAESFTDTSCTPGVWYLYMVRGKNGYTNGYYSQPAMVRARPAAPENFRVAAVSGGVQLSWSSKNSDGTMFRIVRWDAKTKEWKGIALTGSTSYLDRNAAKGAYNGYMVHAYYTTGSGENVFSYFVRSDGAYL